MSLLLQCNWQISSSPLGIYPTSNDFPFIPAMESEYYSTDSQIGDWCRFLLLRLLRSAKECLQLKSAGSVLLQSQLILWTGKAKPKESIPQAGQAMQTHKHTHSPFQEFRVVCFLEGGLKKSLSPPKPFPEREYVITVWAGSSKKQWKLKMKTKQKWIL